MRRSSATLGFFSTLLAVLSFAPVATAAAQQKIRPCQARVAIRISRSTRSTRRRSRSTRPSPSSSRRSSTTCRRKAGVPTPKAVLGDIAGAPGKLPYSKEVYEYMRLLAKAMPGRVKVFSIGTTEEGREHIAVADRVAKRS